MSKWDGLTDEQKLERQKSGIAAWHAWVESHKDVVTEMGGPLGKTKSVGPSGIADIRNAMSGFTIVKAESHEAAAKLFENHPHFSIFPGDAVEVMEIMPVPGVPR
ncbi:MAG: hypothetical protein IPK07_24890 [Deltaproteobacteria bacterium]|nr:hypothetical protein [Deltaproteobacteria bacterium]